MSSPPAESEVQIFAKKHQLWPWVPKERKEEIGGGPLVIRVINDEKKMMYTLGFYLKSKDVWLDSDMTYIPDDAVSHFCVVADVDGTIG